MKLGELAARLGCNLEGDENAEIHGVAGIESARAGEVTFLSNPKYSPELGDNSGFGRVRGRKGIHPARRRLAGPRRASLEESVLRFRAGD